MINRRNCRLFNMPWKLLVGLWALFGIAMVAVAGPIHYVASDGKPGNRGPSILPGTSSPLGQANRPSLPVQRCC